MPDRALLRSTCRELKNRVFFLMGALPLVKCKPTIKLRALVALDALNRGLTRIPRDQEGVFAAILTSMEGALKGPSPTSDLLKAHARLTQALEHIDARLPPDF